jgi:hypothetical protein
VPGKHNAGGCGCCGGGPECFDGCPVAESLILSGSDLHDGCSPADIDGTYALDPDACLTELTAGETGLTGDCTIDYDNFSVNMIIFLSITGGGNYKMSVEITVVYQKFPNSWSQQDIWLKEQSTCPTGTHTLTLDSTAKSAGTDPGYVAPTTVQLVFP